MTDQKNLVRYSAMTPNILSNGLRSQQPHGFLDVTITEDSSYQVPTEGTYDVICSFLLQQIKMKWKIQ